MANIPDDAVARVNGEFIYQADVDKRLDFARFLNDVSKNPTNTVPSAASKLEEIIYERMQLQDARKAGVKVDEQQVDATLGQMETRTGLSSRTLRRNWAIFAEDGRSARLYRQPGNYQGLRGQVCGGRGSRIRRTPEPGERLAHQPRAEPAR